MSSKKSQYFVKFTGDLLTCALRKHDIVWNLNLPDLKVQSPHIFRPTLADAVLIYRNRFEKDFLTRIHDCPEPIFDDSEAFTRYLHDFIEDNFDGEVFLLEVLKLFAFLVDISIYCHKNNREKLITICAEIMEYAYVEYIEDGFDVVGGYSALYRLADQYLEYCESDSIKDSHDISSDNVSKETVIENDSCAPENDKSHCEYSSDNGNPKASGKNDQHEIIVDSEPHNTAMENDNHENTIDNGHTENTIDNGHTENIIDNGHTENIIDNDHTENANANGHQKTNSVKSDRKTTLDNGNSEYIKNDHCENIHDNDYCGITEHKEHSKDTAHNETAGNTAHSENSGPDDF